MEGLIVGSDNGGYLFRSYYNAPDDVDGNIHLDTKEKLAIGSKCKVKITEAYVYDLVAELVI